MFNSQNLILLHRQKKSSLKGSVKRKKKKSSRSSKEKSISREYRSSHGDSSVTEGITHDQVEAGGVTERQFSCLETSERWQGYKPEEVEPIERGMKSDSTAITRHGGVSVMIGTWILKYIILF